MGSKYVSSSVIKRLPRYYRFLGYLMEDGMVRISSRELAERMGLSASQIRQDLNNFGGFGQQGYGYNIESLYNEIGKILGVNMGFKTIMVGAGNLGHTIALQVDYQKRGFDLIGIFDKKESLSGQLINGIPVRPARDIEDFCKDNGVKVAILCVPWEAAREVTPVLVNSGVVGFWNFSHYNIVEDFPQVAVENVHLNDSLMTLCYEVLHDTDFNA